MGEVKAGLNHWTTEVLTCAWNGNRFHTYDDCISESAELGGPATIPRQCSNKSYRDRGTGHTDCQLPLTDVALPNTLSECYTTKRTIAKSFLFENGNEAWVSVKFVSHWTDAKIFLLNSCAAPHKRHIVFSSLLLTLILSYQCCTASS